MGIAALHDFHDGKRQLIDVGVADTNGVLA
jgi:hypothetical protein